MTRNDPLTAAKNIVTLQQPRRKLVVPPRSSAAPIVPFDRWIELRDQASAALLGGTKRVLLTGPAGTGKTVLIEHIARVLRAAGRSVVIQLADTDPAPPALNSTLFVDEADRLSAAKLRELLQAPGSVVLAGLGMLAQRMPKSTVNLVLEPLGQESARAYIAAWLGLTGRVPADLDSMAVRRLVELSGGVPRLLSTLLAAAAWLAKSSNAPVIGAEHVQEAAELRSVMPAVPIQVSEARPRRRVTGSALLATAVILGTAGAMVPRLFPVESSQLFESVGAVADQAIRRVQRELYPPTASQTTSKPVPSAAPTPPPVVKPPAAAAAIAPVMPTAPAAPKAAPTATSTTLPARLASQALPVETVVFLLQRGREMLQLHDVTAARLLFRRAADSGSGEAMLELGRTYDATVLARQGETALADQTQAERWYESATATGNLSPARAAEPK